MNLETQASLQLLIDHWRNRAENAERELVELRSVAGKLSVENRELETERKKWLKAENGIGGLP